MADQDKNLITYVDCSGCRRLMLSEELNDGRCIWCHQEYIEAENRRLRGWFQLIAEDECLSEDEIQEDDPCPCYPHIADRALAGEEPPGVGG